MLNKIQAKIENYVELSTGLRPFSRVRLGDTAGTLRFDAVASAGRGNAVKVVHLYGAQFLEIHYLRWVPVTEEREKAGWNCLSKAFIEDIDEINYQMLDSITRHLSRDSEEEDSLFDVIPGSLVAHSKSCASAILIRSFNGHSIISGDGKSIIPPPDVKAFLQSKRDHIPGKYLVKHKSGVTRLLRPSTYRSMYREI